MVRPARDVEAYLAISRAAVPVSVKHTMHAVLRRRRLVEVLSSAKSIAIAAAEARQVSSLLRNAVPLRVAPCLNKLNCW